MKKSLIVIVTFVSICLLSGCNNTVNEYIKENHPVTSNKVSYGNETLSRVKSFKLTENLFSLDKSYVMKTDKGDKYYFKGKFMSSVVGEELTMTNSNGKVVAKDTQIKRWGVNLNRLAKITDNKDNVIGYLGEEIGDKLSIGKLYHFYDSSGDEIGTGKENPFSFSGKWEIKNSNDKLCYTLKGNFSMSTNIDVEVNDNSKIPVEFAAYYGIIMAEINKDS